MEDKIIMKKNVVLILECFYRSRSDSILIGVTFFLSHYNFISNAARTTAVVTDIKSTATLTVITLRSGNKIFRGRRRILRNYCTLPFDVCRQGITVYYDPI